MGKLVVSLDGVVIKEVQITKEKTTLGRRPYNDIVIDNLAVSGEHAQMQMVGNDVFIEDLNSTNGTYINGKAVRKQLLSNNDTIEIGKYKIKFITEVTDEFERTMIMRPGMNSYAQGMQRPASGMPTAPAPLGQAPAGPSTASANSPAAQPQPNTGFGSVNSGFGGLGSQLPASIKVLNGAAAGREVVLTKVVTTVGKPGVQVASITKRPGGYVFAHVEGAARPAVNGQAVGVDAVPLRHGDVIELAGTEMQFVQA
jgi:pSer/pThr/pTyr-binding forkhead associated (FHA) protein